MSSKSIIGLIFHRKLMLQALLLFNSQHMRRALAAQEWMRKQNHGSCYSKHRLWWLLNSDSVCSSLLPLLFVKMADDSAVLKLFSETFFSLSCSFVHTYLQGAYLVERKNCYSCWQQSNGVSRGQKDGVGHLGDIQTIKWTGGRGSKKEEEAEERQDVSSALTTKELSELPHYITEEAPKHDNHQEQLQFWQQLPGAWVSLWSWSFSALSVYISWQSPLSQTHFTLSHSQFQPPVPPWSQ